MNLLEYSLFEIYGFGVIASVVLVLALWVVVLLFEIFYWLKGVGTYGLNVKKITSKGAVSKDRWWMTAIMFLLVALFSWFSVVLFIVIFCIWLGDVIANLKGSFCYKSPIYLEISRPLFENSNLQNEWVWARVYALKFLEPDRAPSEFEIIESLSEVSQMIEKFDVILALQRLFSFKSIYFENLDFDSIMSSIRYSGERRTLGLNDDVGTVSVNMDQKVFYCEEIKNDGFVCHSQEVEYRFEGCFVYSRTRKYVCASNSEKVVFVSDFCVNIKNVLYRSVGFDSLNPSERLKKFQTSVEWHCIDSTHIWCFLLNLHKYQLGVDIVEAFFKNLISGRSFFGRNFDVDIPLAGYLNDKYKV